MRTPAPNHPPRKIQDVRNGRKPSRTALEIEEQLLCADGSSVTDACTQVAEWRGCSIENVRRRYNVWMRNDPNRLRLPKEDFAENAEFLRVAIIVCREMASASSRKRAMAVLERLPERYQQFPFWLVIREVDIVRSTAADIWTNVGPNLYWFEQKMDALSAFLHVTEASMSRAEQMSGLHPTEVRAVFKGDPNQRALSTLLVCASLGIQVSLMDGKGALLDLSSNESCNNVIDLAHRLGWEASR